MRLTCTTCRHRGRITEAHTAVVERPSHDYQLWWTCPVCAVAGTIDLAHACCRTQQGDLHDLDEIVTKLIHEGCQLWDMSDVQAELEHLTRRPT